MRVCESGITKDLAWRRSQLKGIIRLLTEKEEEMFDVLRDDLGKHRAESYRDEIGALVKSVNHTLRNLERWVAPEKVQAPLVSWTAAVAPRERRLDDHDSGWLIRESTVGEGFSGATVDGFMATCDGCGFMATSQWREPLPAMERWTSAGNDMVTLLAAASESTPFWLKT